MSDKVKLIIEIPKDIYERCKEYKLWSYDAETLEGAVATSKPLSENKGEWIKVQSGDKDFPESIVCSKCRNENSHFDFNEHAEPIGKVFVTSNFCPNCGADMREPKGEKGTE